MPLPAEAAAVKAFPTAEGAGQFASGGRGGKVFRVTNLDDSGPGSLRAALDASGRRTVVFAVAGTIWLESPLRIRNPDITIAGQSAPGGGVCIAGQPLVSSADNVIVRYLRFRPGDQSVGDVDAVFLSGGSDVIFDHCSASWAVDETFSVSSQLDRVTVQWCLISEGLHRSVHSSGDPHSKGSLVYGESGARYSFHHNLWAHHSDRCPQIGNRVDYSIDQVGPVFDFRNNVIYNWGSVSDGWEAAGQNRNRNAISRYNFVNNAYVTGPTTAPAPKILPDEPRFRYRYWAFEELCPRSQAHFAGNTMDGELWPDPYYHVFYEDNIRPDYRLDHPVAMGDAETPTDDANTALADVLATVGASFPRDSVDARVVTDVILRRGGLINSPSDVGGWPALADAPAPVDSDRDGIPDEWERAHGLDPRDSRDGARDRNGDGYTNLEEFLNGLVAAPPDATTTYSVPYAWLDAHGITSGHELAVTDDPDGDGLETWQEHRLGSDPLDPTSGSEVELAAREAPGGSVAVSLTFRQPTDPRVTATIESSTGTTAWEPVDMVPATTIAGGFARTSLEVDPADTRRLFRVRYDFTDAVAPLPPQRQ